MNKRFISIAILTLYTASVLTGLWVILGRRARERKEAVSLGSLVRKTGEKLAVVEIFGPIYMSQRSTGFIKADAERTLRRLKRIRKDPSILGVLLKINSPGGTVAATQEIHAELLKIKKSGKKVVASLGDVAASGGYYVACAADKIVANPGTLTGSIGVILELWNFETLLKKIGAKTETIKSGARKDIGSYARTMTPEERQALQELIDNAYGQFFQAVSEGRKIPKEKLAAFADGSIFTGAQAKEAGLVDSLGGSEEALEVLVKETKIQGEPQMIEGGEEPWERFFDLIPFQERSRTNPLLQNLLPNQRVRFEYILE